MKRFSLRLFALGLVLGALGAAAVLAAGAYARTTLPHATNVRGHTRHARAQESGQPVIDWNQGPPVDREHAGRATGEHPTNPQLRDPSRGDLRRSQLD
jgi:hypothetical protein